MLARPFFLMLFLELNPQKFIEHLRDLRLLLRLLLAAFDCHQEDRSSQGNSWIKAILGRSNS